MHFIEGRASQKKYSKQFEKEMRQLYKIIHAEKSSSLHHSVEFHNKSQKSLISSDKLQEDSSVSRPSTKSKSKRNMKTKKSKINKKLEFADLDNAAFEAFLKMSEQDSVHKNVKSTDSKKNWKKTDKDNIEVDICKAWQQPKEEEKIPKIQELPSRELSEDQIEPEEPEEPEEISDREASMENLKQKLIGNKLYKPESRIKEVEPVPRVDPHIGEKPNKYPMDEFGMFNSSSIKATLKEKFKENEGKESPLKISDPEGAESPQDRIPELPPREEEKREETYQEDQYREEISGDGIIPDEYDYPEVRYGDINDFVNTDIQEDPDEEDYKKHIKTLFEDRPLSIDIDQEEKAPEVAEDLDLDSLSNHALDSKKIEEKEKSKLAELFSKSNFPEKDSLERDLKGDEEKERLPGTVPDLEPELQQYGYDLAKFDPNVEDFLKNPEENLIPDNFGEMLEGDNPDMEKVVNFSTLNSQDQVNEDVEINKRKADPKDDEIKKFEHDLNLDPVSQDAESPKIEVIEDLNELINGAEENQSQGSSKGEIDLDYAQKAEIILTEEKSDRSEHEDNTNNENTQDLLEQFYQKKVVQDPEPVEEAQKNQFQVLSKFEEFEKEKEDEDEEKSEEKESQESSLAKYTLEGNDLEESIDPFMDLQEEAMEGIEDSQPQKDPFGVIGSRSSKKSDTPQEPCDFDFLIQGDRKSEEKKKEEYDKIEDLFADDEPEAAQEPAKAQEDYFNNLIDFGTPKQKEIGNKVENSSDKKNDSSKEHNFGALEDLISFDSNAPQQKGVSEEKKATPIKPYPDAQAENSSDDDDYFERSSQKVEDLFDFPSHPNPDEHRQPVPGSGLESLNKSGEEQELSEIEKSPIAGDLQDYDEIFENEKLRELDSNFSSEGLQSPESRKSSDFGRSPLQNDAFKKSIESPVEFDDPEINSYDGKSHGSPVEKKEPEGEDKKEELLMQTDELIDLYSADPITGRAKEDESLEEDTDEQKEDNNDLKPAFEYEQEEVKRVGKLVEGDDDDQPRREFPIEKILPNLFPESKTQKAKTVKGHLVEEKWVGNISNSSSFKLEKKKEDSTASRKSVVGMFPGTNFETNKSKDLTSRYTDSFCSESDNNSKTNEKGNIENYSNQDIEEIISRDKS